MATSEVTSGVGEIEANLAINDEGESSSVLSHRVRHFQPVPQDNLAGDATALREQCMTCRHKTLPEGGL